MLFHVGTLWRLYETGCLATLKRISSVSGGSIAAAQGRMMISQVGEGRYILLFSEKESGHPEMSVEIFSRGKLLYQGELVGGGGH